MRHREAHRSTLADMSVPPPSQYNDTGSIDGGDMDEGAGASPCNAPSVTHPTHSFCFPLQDLFDVKGRAVQFDAARYPHRNTVHTAGERLVIVLFIPDQSYHDHGNLWQADPDTEALRQEDHARLDAGVGLEVEEVSKPGSASNPAVLATGRELLKEFKKQVKVREPIGKAGRYTRSEQIQCLTLCETRGRGSAEANASKAGVSPANAKQPELHTLVEDYLDLLLQEGVRGKYQSIYMALNASCKPHCDKNNVGLSVVTAIGDFGGGELAIDPTPERHQCQVCLQQRKGVELCRDLWKHPAPDARVLMDP